VSEKKPALTEVLIDKKISHNDPYLQHKLDTHYTNYGSFSDERFFYSDQRADVSEYLEFLSKFICRPGKHNEDVAAAVDNAFFFAYMAADVCMPDRESPGVAFADYFGVANGTPHAKFNFKSDKAIRKQIIDDAQEYLNLNPGIQEFIMGHLDQIDSTGDYSDEALAAAGITFLQIQMHDEKQYINSQIQLLENSFGSDSAR
jgi:hypothetical protein